jgi:heterodisulfide reductase subunit A
VHTALEVFKHDPQAHQYHLYRDVRTYGKYELLYSESREKGSLYLKFAADQPPTVERTGDQLKVTVNDLLTSRKELAIPSDLVVLVTGMIPRENDALVHALKLPVGKDGFYNEIHPKLRPVETVVDGVYIAGACQNPKTAGESAASALAAVTQSASILKKGNVQLDPQVAFIDSSECTGCGACVEACPYEAISAPSGENGQAAYVVSEAICKGCGGCVPECPVEAIRVQGYTHAEIRAMIDGLLMEEVEQI